MGYFDQPTTAYAGGNTRRRPTSNYFAFGGAPRNAGGGPYGGMPLDTQGGLMTNFGAGQMNAASQQYLGHGFMPRTTAGGAFGNPGGFNPDNVLSDQQVGMNAGRMRQYAPMNSAPLSTQIDAPGYAESQNPGGRFFGGAIPGYVGYGSAGLNTHGDWNNTYAGGAGSRPGWLAPSPGPGPGEDAYARAAGILMGKGYTQSPAGQWSRSPGYAVMSPRQLQQQAEGHAAYNKAYQGRKESAREGVLARNDIKKKNARWEMENRAMFSVPGFANQMLQNQNSQGWMDQQAQMFGAKMGVDQQNNQWTHGASLIAAIPEMVKSGAMTPQQGQQAYAQAMGMMGMSSGVPGGGQPTGTPQQRVNAALTPKQQGEVRALKTPQEKEAWLNQQGIMDPLTRSYLLGIRNTPPPSLWRGFGNWMIDQAHTVPGFGPRAPTHNPTRQIVPPAGPGKKPTTRPVPPRATPVIPPAPASPLWMFGL